MRGRLNEYSLQPHIYSSRTGKVKGKARLAKPFPYPLDSQLLNVISASKLFITLQLLYFITTLLRLSQRNFQAEPLLMLGKSS